MSDTYIYEDGAIHNDNKKVVNINVAGKTDVSQILKSFFSKDIEEAEVVPETRKGGRTAEYLFCDKEKRKDEALSQKMADAFVAKLKKEGLSSVTINSSRSNRVNQVFVEMYKEWRNQKLVPFQPNGKACIRFLQDDCKLLIEVGEKTYAEFIRKRIMED